MVFLVVTHTMSNTKPVRAIVVVSDIHAGSTRGLLPPGIVTTSEVEIGLNSLQQFLWNSWVDANNWVADVMGDDPFALVVNGDATEGVHHGTKEVWSPDTRDHLKAAIKILAPLSNRAAATFVVEGTECHTGNQEHTLAEVLKAHPNYEAGVTMDGDPKAWAFQRLTIDMNGVRHVFRHHIGTSVRRNLAATQLSVNLAEEQIEAANNGEVIPQVVCCAHRHKYGEYRDDNGLIIVSPPWQMLTRFAHKVVSQARTKPGLYILDYRGLEEGSLPVVRKRLYNTPAPAGIKL